MDTNVAPILSHISNSGIVQMPGRAFPGIVMQGDSLSGIFDAVVRCLGEAKGRRDEETYYELIDFAAMLQGQLLHYEETLASLGVKLPYAESIKNRVVENDYDA
jgi:hypothetical protein